MTASPTPRRRGRPPRVQPAATHPENATVLRSIDDFLGPAPVLESEDQDGYVGLLEEVRRQVTPNDAIERIYVRDIVDLTWELMRYRRIKIALLHKGQVRAVHQLASSNNWPGLDADAKWSINAAIKISFADGVKELAKYGVTLQDINAHAFSIEREPLLLLDQYMMQIEGRRTFALREIERRRAALGRQLSSVIKEVEGEFKEVRIEESRSNTKEA